MREILKKVHMLINEGYICTQGIHKKTIHSLPNLFFFLFNIQSKSWLNWFSFVRMRAINWWKKCSYNVICISLCSKATSREISKLTLLFIALVVKDAPVELHFTVLYISSVIVTPMLTQRATQAKVFQCSSLHSYIFSLFKFSLRQNVREKGKELRENVMNTHFSSTNRV